MSRSPDSKKKIQDGLNPSILGNPGVTHSVPTAFMNAVGTEWVTPGLPSIPTDFPVFFTL